MLSPPRTRKAPPIPRRVVAAVSEQKEGEPRKYKEYKLFYLVQKTWCGLTNSVGRVLAKTREQAWKICEDKYGPFLYVPNVTEAPRLYESSKGPNMKENFPYVDKMLPEAFEVLDGWLDNPLVIPDRVKNTKRTILRRGIDYDISPPKKKPPPWIRRT
jgi:hypothetical protein